MGASMTRAELAELRRLGRRRQWKVMLIAVAPAVLYLFPAFLPEGSWSWGLSERADIVVGSVNLVWMFYFFFKADQAWKDVGLSCKICKHVFKHQSYEVVMATGRCGGCGARILSDADVPTPNISLQRDRDG